MDSDQEVVNTELSYQRLQLTMMAPFCTETESEGSPSLNSGPQGCIEGNAEGVYLTERINLIVSLKSFTYKPVNLIPLHDIVKIKSTILRVN